MTVVTLLLAGLASAGSGGPDALGYTWIDSNEPGGPAYAFEDISATGTPATDLDDDWEVVGGAFSFPFSGTMQSTISIQTNGGVAFANAEYSLTNSCLPGYTGIDGIIAGYWDDLNPSAAGSGQLFWEVRGSAGVDRRLILQWEGIYKYGTTTPITFQIVLHEGGQIDIAYESISFTPSSGTVGIQHDPSTGLEVLCDGVGTTVSGGMLIRFDPPATDADGDGYDDDAFGGTDCNDADPLTYPGAYEECDGVDNDCDGNVPVVETDQDEDGFMICGGDCDDTSAFVYPGADDPEGDEIDQDCDGFDGVGGPGTGGTGTGTGAGTGGGATGTGTGGTATGTATGSTAGYAKLGCGCSSTDGPTGWIAVGLAVLLARRRR